MGLGAANLFSNKQAKTLIEVRIGYEARLSYDGLDRVRLGYVGCMNIAIKIVCTTIYIHRCNLSAVINVFVSQSFCSWCCISWCFSCWFARTRKNGHINTILHNKSSNCLFKKSSNSKYWNHLIQNKLTAKKLKSSKKNCILQNPCNHLKMLLKL